MQNTSPTYNPYDYTLTTNAMVEFELIDVDAAEIGQITSSVPAVSFSNLNQITDKITQNTLKLATLEPNYWLLDGSFTLPRENGSNGQTGWWSSTLSGADGTFANPIEIEFIFDTPQSSKGFTVIFDTKSQEVCSNFSITTYSGDTVISTISVTDNANVTVAVDLSSENYNKVVLSLEKTSAPYRRARVTEFVFGYIQQFDRDSIFSLKLTYETGLYMQSLPTNKAQFTIDNSNAAYNVLNPDGIYRFLQQGQGINISITVADEEINMGRFYFKSSVADDNALTATVTAYDLIDRLGQTVFSGQGGGRLPAGYTEVEYIESSGTQYIDTGFKPNNNTRVVIDFANIGDYSDNNGYVGALFGSRTSPTSNAFCLWIDDDNLYPNFGQKSHTANGSLTINTALRFVADMNKNVLTANGESLTCTDYTFTSTHSMYLFGLNANGSLDPRLVSGKLYSCQIYDNGTLVRDFVPCKNASDVAGLYDMANDVFYENKGSGTFTAGAELTVPITDVASGVQAVISDSGIAIPINIDATIGARPIQDNFPPNTTHREALRLIGQAGMTHLFINRSGELTAVDFDTTTALDSLTENNMITWGKAENTGLINQVILSVVDQTEGTETKYTATNQQAGEPLQSVKVVNPLATSQAVADWILSIVQNRNKYTVTAQGNPARDITDCISVANVYKTSKNAFVTKQDINYQYSIIDTVTAVGGE